jgi:hypothetical protein
MTCYILLVLFCLVHSDVSEMASDAFVGTMDGQVAYVTWDPVPSDLGRLRTTKVIGNMTFDKINVLSGDSVFQNYNKI